MKKNLWVAVAVLFLAILVVGYFYWKDQRANELDRQSLGREQQAVDDLGKILDDSATPIPTAPSANPLDKVLPAKNPIESANPFKNVYNNPFE